MWVRNDGVNCRWPFPVGQLSGALIPTLPPLPGLGLIYPRGTPGLVYSDDLMWVGLVRDGRSPLIRSGGGLLQTGSRPGIIISKGVPEDTNSASARTYRIRKDYQTADLRQDVADYYNTPVSTVTDAQMEALREQYRKDWIEWPALRGAPLESADGTLRPGIQSADQVAWYAYNDLDSVAMNQYDGTPPIGLEVQATFWAYRGVPEFENVIFKRYRFIYKGTSSTPTTSRIDSMYLCLWSDLDVGNFYDDLAGCDSTLNLGFAYNATTPDQMYKPFDPRTPAIGHILLQGPVLPGNNQDQAVSNFHLRSGFRNLQMTSFLVKHLGWWWNDYFNQKIPSFWWNVVRGTRPNTQVSNELWLDPKGLPTKFIYSGDPINRTGWIDGTGGQASANFIVGLGWPDEKRVMMNTGPFTLALGDTQEVVSAFVAGEGFDGPRSVQVVKYFARLVQQSYPFLAERAEAAKGGSPPSQSATPLKDFSLSQNYPNPFNPSTRIEYTLPIERDVRLALYNVLGQEVRVLDAGLRQAGKYSLEWDGRDTNGRLMPTGVYVYRLEAGSVELKKKMLILR